MVSKLGEAIQRWARAVLSPEDSNQAQLLVGVASPTVLLIWLSMQQGLATLRDQWAAERGLDGDPGLPAADVVPAALGAIVDRYEFFRQRVVLGQGKPVGRLTCVWLQYLTSHL